jgi:hypothetical protein
MLEEVAKKWLRGAKGGRFVIVKAPCWSMCKADE